MSASSGPPKLTESGGRQHGSARDVLDWISWMQHVDWVHSLCDSTATAVAVFNTFKRSAASERGRHIEGIKTI